MLALFREISLRHWMRSRLRSLLVVIGIALGVGLYTATEAASASMLAAFAEFVARVSGRADLSIEGSGLGVPGELVASVAGVDGVEHAAASIELTAQATELNVSLLILGVDFLGDLHFLPFTVEDGDTRVIEDPLAFVNDPSALLIARRFAREHGLEEGSRLKLLTSDGPKDFFVRGVLEDTGAAASFGGQIAVMFIDAAQVSFARGTFVDRIDIALAKGADAGAVKEQLEAIAGPALTVGEPAQIGTRLRELSKPLEAALWTSGFLALLVGGFLVYNAVGIAVAQRRREVGLLRALGVTRRGTTLLFCAEAAAMALPGVGLGLGLGYVLSRYTIATTLEALDRYYATVPQVAQELSPMLALQAVVAGVVMAVLAAWWPARRAAALDPAVVLRGAAPVEATPPAVWKMLIGASAVALLLLLPVFRASRAGGVWTLVLLMLCAVLATPATVIGLRKLLVPFVERLFGVPGRLGLDYVERTLGRSSVNVLALMVAVALSVSVGGWLGSFERSITQWASQVGVSDFSITQGSPVLDRRHVPFTAEASARIAAVSGVKAVQHFRIVNQQIGDVNLRLVATDTDVFMRESTRAGKGWKLTDGAPLALGELRERPAVLLSENAARLLQKGAGDSISIDTPKGSVTLPVRAVIVDYTSELGAIFLDRQHFLEYFADAVVDGIFVYLEPGVNEDQVATALRNAADGGAQSSTVFVSKTKAIEEHILGNLRQTFAYSRAVELMTLLIALMGVVGTMAAAVLDRQREISMLRAIGATTRQVALAIVVEAGFLGFCAAISGIVLGIFECRAFFDTLLAAQTGWHMEFVFPWSAALRTGTLVVVTSALAGALPAWRAARMPIVGASVHE